MKVTYYAAISSDGFIARENGDVSWLDEVEMDMGQIGYEEFFESVDALVMGRHTYDFVFKYGSWPYGDKLTWVLTSSPIEHLEGASIRVFSSIDELVEDAANEKTKHLWLVGGGKLASSFYSSGLLTHLNLAELPVTLGSGIPLFSDHDFSELPFTEHEVIEKTGFLHQLIKV